MGDPTPARTRYVALGDSISIDLYAGGEGRGGPSLLVRNRDDDFPAWRGRDLSSSGEVTFHLLATDGGTTASLLEAQLPAVQTMAVAPTLISVTTGGNDLLAAYGDNRAARLVVARVSSDLSRGLTQLRELAPEAQILVGTVYDPSDGTGDASAVGLPPWAGFVDVLSELNDALRAVATEHDARVADIHGRFLGHGLSRGNVAQPEPRPADRNLWYCSIIEPNAWGADGVRAAFWDALSQS